jgi:hypothetical protein
MSIIAEIIKEIPLSAVLKEKILGLESKLGETETKVTLLEGDLRLCADYEDQDGIYEDVLLGAIQANAVAIKFHVQELQNAGLIEIAGFTIGDGPKLGLTHEGRKYLLSRNSN